MRVGSIVEFTTKSRNHKKRAVVLGKEYDSKQRENMIKLESLGGEDLITVDDKYREKVVVHESVMNFIREVGHVDCDCGAKHTYTPQIHLHFCTAEEADEV